MGLHDRRGLRHPGCALSNNGATWTSPAPLNTNGPTDSGQDSSPQVTTDGACHLVVVWYSSDPLGGTIGTDNDILVARALPDSDKQLVADFGPGYGTWVRRSAGCWGRLHPLSPVSMAAGDVDGNSKADIVIDFGASNGTWLWRNDATWEQLHGLSPESIATGDLDGNGKDEVILDFGASNGVWLKRNDTAWEQLHGLSPKSITTGNVDGNTKDEVILDFGPPTASGSSATTRPGRSSTPRRPSPSLRATSTATTRTS